jgi:hypothetical protein
MNPGARLTSDSVARVSNSISRDWLSGATVNTLMATNTSALVEIVGIRVPPNARVEPPGAGSRSASEAQTLEARLRRATTEATRAARTRC